MAKKMVSTAKALYGNNVSLWRRVFAYLIDVIIVGFIIVLPMGSFISDVPEGDFEAVYDYFTQEKDITFEYILNGFFIALFTVLYWALLEYYLGQSIGKMAMGIRVESLIKIKTQGKAGLSFGQCLTRNVTKVSTMILFLDFMYGIIKGNRRRFFEVLSNTHVVYSENGMRRF